jgi:hypothetical protein
MTNIGREKLKAEEMENLFGKYLSKTKTTNKHKQTNKNLSVEKSHARVRLGQFQ